MNNQEYEQKKRECWEEFMRSTDKIITLRDAFFHAFDRAYALGKREKKAAAAVISGWVARDMNGSLYLYRYKPQRIFMQCRWEGEIMDVSIADDMFPDLTWGDEPQEIELIIKRKKK